MLLILLEKLIPLPPKVKTMNLPGMLIFLLTLAPLLFIGSFITSTNISSPFFIPSLLISLLKYIYASFSKPISTKIELIAVTIFFTLPL